jgi:hypothetical protein
MHGRGCAPVDVGERAVDDEGLALLEKAPHDQLLQERGLVVRRVASEDEGPVGVRPGVLLDVGLHLGQLELDRVRVDLDRDGPEGSGVGARAHGFESPPPSLLLPLPMSLLYTPSVDNS